MLLINATLAGCFDYSGYVHFGFDYKCKVAHGKSSRLSFFSFFFFSSVVVGGVGG